VHLRYRWRPGMGLPDGRYFYNGREYESKEGAARYLDERLSGPPWGLASVALRFKEFTGCTLADAIHTVTSAPAKLLGIGSAKGSLETGKDADIVPPGCGLLRILHDHRGKVVLQRTACIHSVRSRIIETY